jgi:hypothetical protein
VVASFVLVFLLLPVTPQGRTGRLRPPDSVTCDRNKLTSFSGSVTQWSRNDSVARLSMNTDADTKEMFTIRFEKGKAPERWFLLNGQVFKSEDWSKVEVSAGRLRPEIQATAWVCEEDSNPVIDWRLPPK